MQTSKFQFFRIVCRIENSVSIFGHWSLIHKEQDASSFALSTTCISFFLKSKSHYASVAMLSFSFTLCYIPDQLFSNCNAITRFLLPQHRSLKHFKSKPLSQVPLSVTASILQQIGENRWIDISQALVADGEAPHDLTPSNLLSKPPTDLVELSQETGARIGRNCQALLH